MPYRTREWGSDAIGCHSPVLDVSQDLWSVSLACRPRLSNFTAAWVDTHCIYFARHCCDAGMQYTHQVINKVKPHDNLSYAFITLTSVATIWKQINILQWLEGRKCQTATSFLVKVDWWYTNFGHVKGCRRKRKRRVGLLSKAIFDWKLPRCFFCFRVFLHHACWWNLPPYCRLSSSGDLCINEYYAFVSYRSSKYISSNIWLQWKVL